MTNPRPGVEGDIAHLLAEDADIAEQGVSVLRDGSTLVLHGCVNSAALRDLIMVRVSAAFPDVALRDEMTLVRTEAPGDEEVL